MMKFTPIFAVAAIACCAATAGAQEFRESIKRAAQPTQETVRPESFDLKIKTTGVVPRIIRSGQPLQMVNPRARAEYGDGKELVVKDPAAKVPIGSTGITIFGIEF